MRKRASRNGTFEWLCAALLAASWGCLTVSPRAALAQQSGSVASGAASESAAGAGDGAAPAKRADDPEPAVDTSPEAARARSASERGAAQDAQPPAAGSRAAARNGAAEASDRAAGASDRTLAAGPRDSARGKASAQRNATDHLELGTTDITGNRELPKVMYIVPWKRSDLGDITGKPLDSLIDQTLEPVDRDVFRRENQYYRAVTGDGADGGAAPRAQR